MNEVTSSAAIIIIIITRNVTWARNAEETERNQWKILKGKAQVKEKYLKICKVRYSKVFPRTGQEGPTEGAEI
jgi:hypothetical protein